MFLSKLVSIKYTNHNGFDVCLKNNQRFLIYLCIEWLISEHGILEK